MFKDELRIIPGSVINYEIIRADLKAMQKIYKIEKVGFDPWNAKEFSNILEKDGFEMVQIGQSAKDLTDPIRQLESQIISGNLCHFGSKVLRWMAGNCFLWTDTNGKAAKVIKRTRTVRARLTV
jgi:Phage terminase-like protein, large subunit